MLGADELALRRSIIAEQLGRETEALDARAARRAAAPGRRDLVMRVQELATRIGELDCARRRAQPCSISSRSTTTSDAARATRSSSCSATSATSPPRSSQLERILRDHPHHAPRSSARRLHVARGDWPTATRYLYQLVPLAPTPAQRAERLLRLGEAVLVHLGDVDRADDVFLRASDLDPPTSRRCAACSTSTGAPTIRARSSRSRPSSPTRARSRSARSRGSSLAHALVAAALVGDTTLAGQLGDALGDDAPPRIAAALAELANREGRFQLASASTAIAELGRRGLLDLARSARTRAARRSRTVVVGDVGERQVYTAIMARPVASTAWRDLQQRRLAAAPGDDILRAGDAIVHAARHGDARPGRSGSRAA